MYLIPEDVADRQREYRPVVIRGVVKLQYLSGYGMQRDERLHVRFGAADADIPSSFRSRSDVTGMESPRIRVGQTGQRGEVGFNPVRCTEWTVEVSLMPFFALKNFGRSV